MWADFTLSAGKWFSNSAQLKNTMASFWKNQIHVGLEKERQLTLLMLIKIIVDPLVEQILSNNQMGDAGIV